MVFMAEVNDLANNAQMASVPQHPLWWSVFKLLQKNAKEGIVDPLKATGPGVITNVLKVCCNLKKTGYRPRGGEG